MGPRVNKQGQSELLLTRDCISTSYARTEPIAHPTARSQGTEARLDVTAVESGGAGSSPAPFLIVRQRGEALLEAVKSAGVALFFASFLMQMDHCLTL